IAADLAPRITRVIAAHDVPVFLHKQRVRALRVHRDVMDAMADLCFRIGNVLRMQALIDWLPALAAIVSSEGACRRDGNEDSRRIFRIEKNGVQTHSARARLPFRAGAVAAQSGELLPRLT